MLDPTPLLGSLAFTVVGRGRVAGRGTITAETVPRRRDPRHDPRSFELYDLGGGGGWTYVITYTASSTGYQASLPALAQVISSWRWTWRGR